MWTEKSMRTTLIRALLRGGGDGSQTFYLLLESLTWHRSRINYTTVS